MGASYPSRLHSQAAAPAAANPKGNGAAAPRPKAMVTGNARAMLAMAEHLEALERGETPRQLPPGAILNPTAAQVAQECRRLRVEPPSVIPKDGWFNSRSFCMAALEQRLRKLEPPFCWQAKEALRRIREHLDGDSLLPFALLAYLALTVNASDQQTEEFTTLQSHLSRLAGGISTRTLQRVLPILREIGLIDYRTPKLRGPITFRILSVRTPYPNDTTDSRNDTTDSRNVATGSFSAFQADNRIIKEESKKNKKKNTLSRSRSTSACAAGSNSGGNNQILSASESEAFSAFWKLYPRRVGRRDAMRAWKRHSPPLEKVLRTVAAFSATPQWQEVGRRYVPHPATWLNRAGWDDEPPTAAAEPESFI